MGWGASAPGKETHSGPGLCTRQRASASRLIFKTTLQNIIILILPLGPFQSSERENDSP